MVSAIQLNSSPLISGYYQPKINIGNSTTKKRTKPKIAALILITSFFFSGLAMGDSYNHVATMFQNPFKFNTAQSSLALAVQYKLDTVDVYKTYTDIAVRTGHISEAQQTFEVIVKRGQNQIVVAESFFSALVKAGKFPLAEEVFLQTTENKPNNYEAFIKTAIKSGNIGKMCQFIAHGTTPKINWVEVTKKFIAAALQTKNIKETKVILMALLFNSALYNDKARAEICIFFMDQIVKRDRDLEHLLWILGQLNFVESSKDLAFRSHETLSSITDHYLKIIETFIDNSSWVTPSVTPKKKIITEEYTKKLPATIGSLVVSYLGNNARIQLYAESTNRELLKKHNAIDSHAYVAQILRHPLEFNVAANILNQTIQYNLDNEDLYRAYMEIAVRSGHISEAQQAFEKAKNRGRNQIEVAESFVSSLVKVGKFPLAEEVFLQATGNKPNNYEAFIKIAIKNGNIEEICQFIVCGTDPKINWPEVAKNFIAAALQTKNIKEAKIILICLLANPSLYSNAAKIAGYRFFMEQLAQNNHNLEHANWGLIQFDKIHQEATLNTYLDPATRLDIYTNYFKIVAKYVDKKRFLETVSKITNSGSSAQTGAPVKKESLKLYFLEKCGLISSNDYIDAIHKVPLFVMAAYALDQAILHSLDSEALYRSYISVAVKTENLSEAQRALEIAKRRGRNLIEIAESLVSSLVKVGKSTLAEKVFSQTTDNKSANYEAFIKASLKNGNIEELCQFVMCGTDSEVDWFEVAKRFVTAADQSGNSKKAKLISIPIIAKFPQNDYTDTDIAEARKFFMEQLAIVAKSGDKPKFLRIAKKTIDPEKPGNVLTLLDYLTEFKIVSSDDYIVIMCGYYQNFRVVTYAFNHAINHKLANKDVYQAYVNTCALTQHEMEARDTFRQAKEKWPDIDTSAWSNSLVGKIGVNKIASIFFLH